MFCLAGRTLEGLDVDTGAPASVPVDPALSWPGVDVFGCGLFVTGSGGVLDDTGRLLGSLPHDSVWAAVRTGSLIVAAGGPLRDERVFLLDPATGALLHELPAAYAGFGLAAWADELVIVRGKGCASVITLR